MRSRRFAGALLALTLVAAACGGDDDSADTTDAPSAPETTMADDMASETTMADDMATETTMADDMASETTMADDMTDVPENWPEKLMFGFVPSQEQEQLQDDIQPFIDVLEAGLGIEVEGVVTTDYTGLVTAMGSGQADLGAFGPFGYVLGKDNFGNIEALIQSIRFGSPTYHGQWFTNDASICAEPPVAGTALENVDGEIVQVDALEAIALQVGVDFDADGNKVQGKINDNGDVISPGSSCIGSLEDVAGKTIAFTTETSTSGYLFPALELTELGIDPQNDVTPVFTGGHDAAVTAVYNGDAEIGLSFDDARSTIDDDQRRRRREGDRVLGHRRDPERRRRRAHPTSRTTQAGHLRQRSRPTSRPTRARPCSTRSTSGPTSARPSESDFDIVRAAANALGITEPPG